MAALDDLRTRRKRRPTPHVVSTPVARSADPGRVTLQTRRRAPPDARRRAPPPPIRYLEDSCPEDSAPKILFRRSCSEDLAAARLLFVSPRAPKLYDGTRPLGCPSRVFIRATTHFSHERGKR